jgi:hypothetical protein
VLAGLVCALGTAAAGLVTSAIVSDQQERLLTVRTNEVKLVLQTAVAAIPQAMQAQGDVLRATNRSSTAWQRVADRALAADPNRVTFAWVRPGPDGGFLVTASAGKALEPGQVVRGPRARTMQRALRDKRMVTSPVFGAGRQLGFALGPPAAPPGSVLYRETLLGPLRAPRLATTDPFSELEVAIYGRRAAGSRDLLASTTPDTPLQGQVRHATFAAGADTWRISVSPRSSLVGTVADGAPVAVVVLGLVGSLLVATVVEIALRRRNAALALYESEQQAAEALQRSLLPQLPDVPGLDLSARYLPSGSGQQVGGDWFDVFPVASGRVGLAIGDVIGHDLAAASAMAQVRASLRAYALHGDPPATVMNQLGTLVETLGLTTFVTVVYALLGSPEPDGSRLLQWSNAGHLAPMLRDPSGQVRALEGGRSVVLGPPVDQEHDQADAYLPDGSTLLLYTDGLVEVPGRSLDEGIERLAVTVSAAGQTDSEDLCRAVLDSVLTHPLRDDVALLAVGIGPMSGGLRDSAEPDRSRVTAAT